MLYMEDGIQMQTIFGDGGGLQLIEQRQFEAIGQIALPFQFAEEFLDHIARHDHHNDGLQVFLGVRQNMDAPNDLCDWNGRQLFQLQLDHRKSFVEVAAGKN